ncbi:MAG: hypothetical protein IME96_10630 [Proteobacteria bacterium]|nr:hypothetical protein [Pseudomonadota bacterium]
MQKEVTKHGTPEESHLKKHPHIRLFTVSHIRDGLSKVTIIEITAHAYAEEKDRIIDACITKPLSRQALLDAISENTG